MTDDDAPSRHDEDGASDGLGALSRRRLLTGAAGAAVIAAGAATLSSGPAGAATPLRAGAGADHVVAHVRDVHTGAVDVYAGTSQTTIYDRELAVRLANAAH